MQNPSAFNCNVAWILNNYFFTVFRNLQFQSSILKTGFDIFLLYILSYMETSAELSPEMRKALAIITITAGFAVITVLFITALSVMERFVL